MSNNEQVEQINAILAGEDDDQAATDGDQAASAGDSQAAQGADHSGDDAANIDDDIARLLADQGVEDDTEGAAQSDGDAGDAGDHATEAGEGDAPITVKGLAEQLGVDAKDIYNELVIPLGDDQTTTLGEWKDRVKELGAIDEQRQAVDDSKATHEREVLAMRGEINALMAMLPEQNRDSMMAMARDRNSAYLADQKRQVMDAIPEWKDHKVLAADSAGIVEMGSEYGFSKEEITHTPDARTLLMLRDFMRLRGRVAAMDAAGKKQAAKPNRPGKAKPKQAGKRRLAAAFEKAKNSANPRDAQAVVAQLIRNQ